MKFNNTLYKYIYLLFGNKISITTAANINATVAYFYEKSNQTKTPEMLFFKLLRLLFWKWRGKKMVAWACACLLPDSGKHIQSGIVEQNVTLSFGEID